MLNLGKLEKVPVRCVWKHEAHDFTPWLAAHLDELGEALGLDLDVQQVEEEAPVGTFSLDILVRDAGGERPVIIENQLGKTDHDHLGKLLTYAAGYNAGAIVWVTGEFTDEHRAAVDWLNQETGEDVQFFGVVVEAWKIGNSLAAPHFSVVAAPNAWSKRGKSDGAGGVVSQRRERQQVFFQRLVDTMREEHQFTKLKRAGAKGWVSFPLGIGGAGVNAAFGGQGLARVEVYLNRGTEWNKAVFDGLFESKENIQNELRCELNWERLDDKKACRISVVREGAIDDDDEALESLREWMAGHLLTFEKVFGSRIGELVQQGLP